MPEQTDRLTDRLTDRRTDRKVKTEGPKIMFIESRLQLTLIIGGPIFKCQLIDQLATLHVPWLSLLQL